MNNNYDSVGSRTRSRNYEVKHESHPTGNMKVESMNRPMDRSQSKHENHPTGCFAKMKSPTGHLKVENTNLPMDRCQSKHENHPTGCFTKMKSQSKHENHTTGCFAKMKNANYRRNYEGDDEKSERLFAWRVKEIAVYEKDSI